MLIILLGRKALSICTSKHRFPAWEWHVPTLGMKRSHVGDKVFHRREYPLRTRANTLIASVEHLVTTIRTPWRHNSNKISNCILSKFEKYLHPSHQTLETLVYKGFRKNHLSRHPSHLLSHKHSHSLPVFTSFNRNKLRKNLQSALKFCIFAPRKRTLWKARQNLAQGEGLKELKYTIITLYDRRNYHYQWGK